MNNTENINQVLFDLFQQQTFVEAELDYCVLDKHKPNLQKLADIGNSMITVMDVYRKQHVFHSSNFGALLGYSSQEVGQYGEYFLNAIIHPEDLPKLMQNGLTVFKLYLNFSEREKLNYKIINEFRVLNASNQYIRVIEQHQTLELDKLGNLWLALSILDVSPNQELQEGLKSQVLNFRTGEFLTLTPENSEIKVSLTKREAEILKLVKDGLLSKEISDKLFISVHTVNTHRQRFLEKLGANNSMEAVVLSSKLGLV